jgi:hypothetical protein
MPGRFEALYRGVPAGYCTWAPDSWGGIPGERFSALGQLCHLRDIECDGYHVRFRRVLAEADPALESVDGYALAKSRRYDEADEEEALRAFRAARKTTLGILGGLDATALKRGCSFDEFGRLSLEGLIHVLCSHDEQHLACMHWLLGKMASADIEKA